MLPDHARAPIATWLLLTLALALTVAAFALSAHCEAQAAVEAML